MFRMLFKIPDETDQGGRDLPIFLPVAEELKEFHGEPSVASMIFGSGIADVFAESADQPIHLERIHAGNDAGSFQTVPAHRLLEHRPHQNEGDLPTEALRTGHEFE